MTQMTDDPWARVKPFRTETRTDEECAAWTAIGGYLYPLLALGRPGSAWTIGTRERGDTGVAVAELERLAWTEVSR